MKVYVFGNPDTSLDNRVYSIVERLKQDLPEIKFVEIKPNQDLPFSNKEPAIILDTVAGIKDVAVFKNEDLDKFSASNRTSVHDFDLAFQLKYLKKLGKLGKITIIGVPQKGDADYFLIQSILRKLVAQDIQGS